MVKRSLDQKIRARNFEARNERIETGAVVKNRRDQCGVARGLGECYQWRGEGQCSKGDNCSFRHEGPKRGRWTPKTAPSSERRKVTRKTCRDYMNGKCTKPSCEFWHPPECQYYRKPSSGCRFDDKCAFMHQQVQGQPSKKPKKQSDEGAVATLKNSRHLGCVFQDVEPPKFTSILRKARRWSPARTVQFSKNTQRHRKIRESKGPSLGVLTQRTSPHERIPYAPKFEGRSQEETERQERCARGDTWRVAEGFVKLKEKDKATLFSPPEVSLWLIPEHQCTCCAGRI